MDELLLYVNGVEVRERFKTCEPDQTLLEYLRREMNLCGTKLACGEGGCGACTVMVSEMRSGAVVHSSVNACLTPVAAVGNCLVTTIEGIGARKDQLEVVQEEMIKAAGAQCGFCTSGMIMTMYTLLRNNPTATMKEIHQALQGNLCRCTGYRPILEAAKNAKDRLCSLGEKCCRNNNAETMESSQKSSFKPISASQEPIFPPALRSVELKPKVFVGDTIKWYVPTSLDQLLALKSEHPDAKLITGNTECRLEQKFRKVDYPVQIFTRHVPELCEINVDDKHITFGSAVTITEIKKFLIKSRGNVIKNVSLVDSILKMINLFAGDQIRNVASIGGNIMTSSPISDLNQLWMAIGAEVELASPDGPVRISLRDNFFTGYRRNRVNTDQIISKLVIPQLSKNAFCATYKVSKRNDDDIAIVNAAFCIELASGDKIKSLVGSFGGMGPMTRFTSFDVASHAWFADDDTLAMCIKQLNTDFALPADVPGGSAAYRTAMTGSFLTKFYMESRAVLLNKFEPNIEDVIGQEEEDNYTFKQDYPDSVYETVGKGAHMNSAEKHVTGTSKYLDDMPYTMNECFMAPVQSQHPHANIISIDYSAALKVDGVVGYVDQNDVPGSNDIMQMWQNEHAEKVYFSKTVTATGQIIAAIIAKSKRAAQKGASLVKVEYELLDPILTLSEAIEANTALDPTFNIENGDVDEALVNAEFTLRDTFTVGGQEHFYFEPFCARAEPVDSTREVVITASTQWQSFLQKTCAKALGVPQTHVHVHTKRLGGGFGGKEIGPAQLAASVAIAAVKFNSVGPVRCVLERDEDMLATGTRHPAQFKYAVGFDKTGRITALENQIYLNIGYAQDLSIGVCYRATVCSFNCYNIENIHVEGKMMRTNTPSNTAFRGFGAPQGMLCIEHIITRVAHRLNLDPTEVRRINMLSAGDVLPFGEVNHAGDPHTIERPYNLTEMTELTLKPYDEKRQLVDQFNREHKYKKRGLAFIPTMYTCGYELKWLNHGHAYVMIYEDGSVYVQHGGIEMGQGLHTKMMQIAAEVLQIPLEKCHTYETSTNTIANATATAASFSADLNGWAVKDACEKLMNRLDMIREMYGHVTWEELIKKAIFHRVDLASTGFFRSRKIDFDGKQGWTYTYAVYGTAVTEVELDVLTGQHIVLRSDLMMDIGRSINPELDIGQIEGAFVQGMGMYTSEEIMLNKNGKRFTLGPGKYSD